MSAYRTRVSEPPCASCRATRGRRVRRPFLKELILRFNEENDEKAGEHWTPADAGRLLAKLIFRPIADQIKSSSHVLYGGACETGGVLTVVDPASLRTMS